MKLQQLVLALLLVTSCKFVGITSKAKDDNTNDPNAAARTALETQLEASTKIADVQIDKSVAPEKFTVVADVVTKLQVSLVTQPNVSVLRIIDNERTSYAAAGHSDAAQNPWNASLNLNITEAVNREDIVRKKLDFFARWSAKVREAETALIKDKKFPQHVQLGGTTEIADADYADERKLADAYSAIDAAKNKIVEVQEVLKEVKGIKIVGFGVSKTAHMLYPQTGVAVIDVLKSRDDNAIFLRKAAAILTQVNEQQVKEFAELGYEVAFEAAHNISEQEIRDAMVRLLAERALIGKRPGFNKVVIGKDRDVTSYSEGRLYLQLADIQGKRLPGFFGMFVALGVADGLGNLKFFASSWGSDQVVYCDDNAKNDCAADSPGFGSTKQAKSVPAMNGKEPRNFWESANVNVQGGKTILLVAKDTKSGKIRFTRKIRISPK